ncbi:NAD(P)H-binding protein [Gemmata sp. JC673]|uniref:NAD(P)H-binding protein n=1 Tax=Gemmata algarum TaxID=2975278 RepID=A0ABU5EYJ6_9BACT|nr:NAD(P)H-binding protein [Gemmata algarum]MDY3558719.1 NAD(P)H-binding protein [Gemmata algarum]
MKIVLFGATGMIGQRVLAEALNRGHAVTVVARDPSKVTAQSPSLNVVRGDLTDPASVPSLVTGADVVVSAFAPSQGREGQVADVARTLVRAVGAAEPPPRLVVVGGAGGLEVGPALRVIDTPTFPAFLKPIAQAHINAYEVYRTANVDWTFFAPAALIQPGQRTGRYRTGRDQLVVDDAGNSSISAEDYAVALLDEIEKPQFRRSRMTAAN